MRYATQCVPPDRNEATFDGIHIGESRRHQDRLIDRTAHRRNPAHLVYRWTYHGKVEPFAAPDFTIKSSEDVAKAAVGALEHGKRTVAPGVAAKFATIAGRVTPRTVLLPTLRRRYPVGK